LENIIDLKGIVSVWTIIGQEFGTQVHSVNIRNEYNKYNIFKTLPDVKYDKNILRLSSMYNISYDKNILCILCIVFGAIKTYYVFYV